MKITLKSRIGNCNLDISAVAETLLAIGQAAIKQIVSHDSASEAYKEKSPYKRTSPYDDGLANHVKAIVSANLIALGFTDVAIVTSAYVADSPYDKFVKSVKGLDADTIAAMWAIHPLNPDKGKTKVEPAKAADAPVSLS